MSKIIESQHSTKSSTMNDRLSGAIQRNEAHQESYRAWVNSNPDPVRVFDFDKGWTPEETLFAPPSNTRA